jgi:FkbM family methyltransferase
MWKYLNKPAVLEQVKFIFTNVLVRTGAYPGFYPCKAAAFHMLQQAAIPRALASRILNMRPGDVCIDCGSHAGDITAIFRALGATVYGFEPNTNLFVQQMQRFRHDSGVTLINKAVWNQAARLPLNALMMNGTPNLGGSSILQIDETDMYQQSVLQEEVEVIDLIPFVKDLTSRKRISILKLDVEGAEFDILDSLLKECLHHQIDSIFCETHARFFADGNTRLENLRRRLARENITNVYLDWL